MLLVATGLAAGCAHKPASKQPILEHLRFRGNAHVPSSEIRDRIQLQPTSWIPFTTRRRFDPLALDVDRQRIEALYQARGFFDAKVAPARVTRSGRGVDVEFSIEEGVRTLLSRVDITGLEVLDEKARRRLLRKLPLAAGQPFNHDRYTEAKTLLTSRLRDTGHAWAKVEGEARVNRDQHDATIELRVDPGPIAKLGRVDVHGAPSGSDVDDIADRSGLVSGARYNATAIETGRGRLLSTGRFDRVRIDATPRPDDPTVADVVIEVIPGSPNEIKLGVGVGLDRDRDDVHLRFRYVRYGFLGGLRALTVRAMPELIFFPKLPGGAVPAPALVSDVTFTQPDLGVRDLSLRIQVGYDLGADYAFRYHGPRIGTGLEYSLLGGRLVFAASYHFEYLFFFHLTAPDVFTQPELARAFLGYTNPYRLAYLVEQIGFDLRDSPLDPHRGVLFRITVEEGAFWLGGAFNYQKITPEVRGYVPIVGNRLVLSARVMFGRLYTQDPSSPITRRFYLGGAESHRGFAYDRLSPQVPTSDGSYTFPIGGDHMILAQAELRGEIAKLWGSWVGLAAFVDAGDVTAGDVPLDLSQLHVAVGPGLRYYTAIGVIRADLGVRLNRLSPFQPDGRPNPDPGDRIAFHLSIGEAF